MMSIVIGAGLTVTAVMTDEKEETKIDAGMIAEIEIEIAATGEIEETDGGLEAGPRNVEIANVIADVTEAVPGRDPRSVLVMHNEDQDPVHAIDVRKEEVEKISQIEMSQGCPPSANAR